MLLFKEDALFDLEERKIKGLKQEIEGSFGSW